MASKQSTRQSIDTASDAGGVAARVGFKYQDHVAANLVLSMLSSPHLHQVECETADDIVLVWATFTEYVQVKTTEEDKKWSQTEICERGSGTLKTKPTSLIEKSLLCDVRVETPRFRIVSRRDLNKALTPLKGEVGARSDQSGVDRLAKNFLKAWKTTKSPKGRDLAYWAQNVLWQVAGDSDSLAARNKQQLSHLAESFGANPTHGHLEDIYRKLLNMVQEAAEASRVKDPSQKILTRTAALSWWKKHVAETESAMLRSAKPYRVSSDAFFAELHNVSETDVLRAMTGYDAQYESRTWRAKQLAEYLADWLPEVALKASELVAVQGQNLREKLRLSLKRINAERQLEIDRIMAEMLLHAILRHRFQSEPIACKLFYQSGSTLRTFGNAHIVHGDSDMLWLGRALLAPSGTYEQLLTSVLQELKSVLDPDFLKDEREVIMTLREPQHLQFTTLEDALKRLSPIDELLSSLSIAVLAAYDSDSLKNGFTVDYKAKLISEVQTMYKKMKPALPASLSGLHVHIFLVPVESAEVLVNLFKREIEG